MRNRKMQENLQKILAIRKNVLNNHFKNFSNLDLGFEINIFTIGAKQGKYEESSEFFWVLINEIEETFVKELDLFDGYFIMENKIQLIR